MTIYLYEIPYGWPRIFTGMEAAINSALSESHIPERISVRECEVGGFIAGIDINVIKQEITETSCLLFCKSCRIYFRKEGRHHQHRCNPCNEKEPLLKRDPAYIENQEEKQNASVGR